MHSNNKNNIYKKGESFFYKLGFFMGYHSYIIDSAVSAPAICYAGLLLTSIVFIVISVICTDMFLLDGFFTNLGYGIFCSTFVAVLVDYGATKRKKEKDNNDYRSFTMKVKQNINSLIDFRIHNEFKYKELSRLTYCQWISGLFNIESTAPEYKKIRTEFIDICKRLLFSVLSLKDYSGILAGNFYLPDRFFNHLDNLCEQLRLVVRNRDIDSNTASELFQSICVIFPEYEIFFEDKWNQLNVTLKRMPEREPFKY